MKNSAVRMSALRHKSSIESPNPGPSPSRPMAKEAKKLGYSYIAITDHAGTMAITNSLSGPELIKQGKRIDAINKKLRGIKILKSAEVNILKDGSLDVADKYLKQLDIVLVAIHDHFKLSEAAMTERIIKAMQNPYVNIIGHPTGRLIFKREGIKVNMEKVLKAAKQYHVAMEINAFPNRLDLRDTHIRMAVDTGTKLTIGTDSHAPEQLHNAELGIAQARRGWARKSDIVNTLPLQKLKAWFNKK